MKSLLLRPDSGLILFLTTISLWINCCSSNDFLSQPNDRDTGSDARSDHKTGHDRNLRDALASAASGIHAHVSDKAFDDSVYYQIQWMGNQLDDFLSIESKTHESRGSKSNLIQEVIARGQDGKMEEEENGLWVTTSEREVYYCQLPRSLSKANSDQSTNNAFEGISPFQLLKPLFAREVCSYRLEQYWTYELCHGRFIRQFHEESTVQKLQGQEYYLGKYDLSQLSLSETEFEAKLEEIKREGRKRPTVQVEGVQVPFIEVNMTGGTLCDLSNKPRFTRVLYVCSEDSKHELHSIKETYTCEYEAIVLSPLLCLHSDFRTNFAPENDISCFAVGKAPAKPKGLAAFESSSRKQRKPESIFDGKTIIIGSAEGIGKELKFDIRLGNDGDDETTSDGAEKGPPVGQKEKQNAFSEKPSFDSKIVRNFLTGDLCLQGGTGWWKYEFCYGEKVEQYHEDKGGKRATIRLGKWDRAEHFKWLERNPHKRPKAGKTPRQVSHFYGNGDICEITGKPRTIEVKLKCRYIEGHLDSVALYLLEPKTCEYILGLESPIICHLLSSVDENGMMQLNEEM